MVDLCLKIDLQSNAANVDENAVAELVCKVCNTSCTANATGVAAKSS